MSRSGLALTIGFATEAVRESAPHIQCVAPLAATPFVADALHGAGARSLVTGTSPDALAAAQGADAVVLDQLAGQPAPPPIIITPVLVERASG